MANPQTENGYTTICNEILEVISKTKLNGTQFRIVMTVWRSTYGWNKKEHDISESYLSTATNIHKQQIKRELKELLNKKILLVTKEATFNTSRIIKFNKNYDDWQLNSLEVAKKIPHSELDTSTGSELDTSTGSELDTQKNNIKNNIKNNKGQDYKSLYDYYLTLGLIRHQNYTDAMRNAIKKAMKQNKYSLEDCKVLLERHSKVVELSKKADFKVKARGLDVFFGQKVYNGTNLICSEYEEGGSKYETYFNKPKQESIYKDASNHNEGWIL